MPAPVADIRIGSYPTPCAVDAPYFEVPGNSGKKLIVLVNNTDSSLFRLVRMIFSSEFP